MPTFDKRKAIKMAKLEKSTKFEGVKGPLLTIVMDGVGIAPDNAANAVAAAHTPTLDKIGRASCRERVY